VVVFQRIPNFSIPAHNGPLSREKLAQLDDEAEYRRAAKMSVGGIPIERSITATFSVSEVDRQRRYQRAREIGELFETLNVYADVMTNRAANDELAEFFRNKIRPIVDDPQTRMPDSLRRWPTRICNRPRRRRSRRTGRGRGSRRSVPWTSDRIGLTRTQPR
jgi:hypothetical protein